MPLWLFTIWFIRLCLWLPHWLPTHWTRVSTHWLSCFPIKFNHSCTFLLLSHFFFSLLNSFQLIFFNWLKTLRQKIKVRKKDLLTWSYFFFFSPATASRPFLQLIWAAAVVASTFQREYNYPIFLAPQTVLFHLEKSVIHAMLVTFLCLSPSEVLTMH